MDERPNFLFPLFWIFARPFPALKTKGVRGGEKRDNGPKFLVICQAFLSSFETAQFRKGEKGVTPYFGESDANIFLGGEL